MWREGRKERGGEKRGERRKSEREREERREGHTHTHLTHWHIEASLLKPDNPLASHPSEQPLLRSQKQRHQQLTSYIEKYTKIYAEHRQSPLNNDSMFVALLETYIRNFSKCLFKYTTGLYWCAHCYFLHSMIYFLKPLLVTKFKEKLGENQWDLVPDTTNGDFSV